MSVAFLSFGSIQKFLNLPSPDHKQPNVMLCDFLKLAELAACPAPGVPIETVSTLSPES